MRQLILLILFCQFFSGALSAQVYQQVTAYSGIQPLTGTNVTIIPIDSCEPGILCGVAPYWTHTGGVRFVFSKPVKGIRSQLMQVHIGDTMTIKLNGVPYTVTAGNLADYGDTPCVNMHNTVIASVGKITGTVSASGNYTGVQLDIVPGFDIDTVEFYENRALGGGIVFDLFVLTGCNGKLKARHDTACLGSSFHLYAFDTGIASPTTYSWAGPNGYISNQKNPTVNNATIFSAGYYVVTDSAFCIYKDSTYVTVNDAGSFVFGNDTTVCSPILLQVPTVPGAAYIWQDSSTANTFMVNKTGTYFVTSLNKGCVHIASIFVKYIDTVTHVSDTMLCAGQAVLVIFNSHTSPGESVKWSNNSIDSTIEINDTGKYWVTVSESTCMRNDTFKVHSQFCDCEAFIPDIFSPNDDTKNDILHVRVQQGCIIDNVIFTIYNRWGQRVYINNFISKGWDGNLDGLPMPVGLYMYKIEYQWGIEKRKYEAKGEIMLVR